MARRAPLLLVVLVLLVAACQPPKKAPPPPAVPPPVAGTLYYINTDFGGGGGGPTDNLYALDTGTAAPTLIGPSGVDVNTPNVALAESPTSGVLFGSNPVGILRINTDGSGFTRSGSTGWSGMAWDPVDAVLYGTSGGGFHQVDTTTGGSALVLTPPGGTVEGLAWRGTDGLVYGLRTDGMLRVYTPATDTWADGGATGITNPTDLGLAWDSQLDIFYAIQADGDLYEVDPATAAATLIGNTGLGRGGGLAFVV